MINGINGPSNLGKTTTAGVSGGAGASGTPATSFSDTLKDSIEEVARLQQEASQATESLLTGQTQDITGVFTAMEKSDIAFKTLLAIRGKLMDAFEEIKNMPI
jgi:flagellar hook-basal body complex protein FliE